MKGLGFLCGAEPLPSLNGILSFPLVVTGRGYIGILSPIMENHMEIDKEKK